MTKKYRLGFASGAGGRLDGYLGYMLSYANAGDEEGYNWHYQRYLEERKTMWFKQQHDGRMVSLDEVARLVVAGGPFECGFIFDGETITIYDDYVE